MAVVETARMTPQQPEDPSADDAKTADSEKPVRIRTAWHPVAVTAIELTLPAGWYQCLSEFQLMREPARVDLVIVRRTREGTPPPPRLLSSVLSELAEHTLVHFKGPTAELERDDALMLLAYALQYVVVAEVADLAKIALRVVAPRMPPRFVSALKALGCPVHSPVAGIHEGRLGVFPLRVVETVVVNARAGEHLLYTVTPHMVTNPRGFPGLSSEELRVFWALREYIEQLRHPLPNTPRRVMKDEEQVIESFNQVMIEFIAKLPPEQVLRAYAPEQVLRAYAPEQVLRAYAPEQRVAGLAPEQVLLALPDAALRGLTDEYYATLPEETRAAIRKRIGRG